jgi:hypothetical protein
MDRLAPSDFPLSPGVASRWTVVKVARGADDAHCRGRLVGFIWRELHHDGERDEAVLLRVLQPSEHSISSHQKY